MRSSSGPSRTEQSNKLGLGPSAASSFHPCGKSSLKRSSNIPILRNLSSVNPSSGAIHFPEIQLQHLISKRGLVFVDRVQGCVTVTSLASREPSSVTSCRVCFSPSPMRKRCIVTISRCSSLGKVASFFSIVAKIFATHPIRFFGSRSISSSFLQAIPSDPKLPRTTHFRNAAGFGSPRHSGPP